MNMNMNENMSLPSLVYVDDIQTLLITVTYFAALYRELRHGKMGKCLTALQHNISLKCIPHKWLIIGERQLNDY